MQQQRSAASRVAVAASLRRAAAAVALARAACSAPAPWPSAPAAAATPLPRLHAPTAAAFDAALHGARTPFIVTGALRDWPAARWTPAELARRFGDVHVPVELSRRGADYRHRHHPDPRARALFRAGEEMPLAAFVARYMEEPPPSDAGEAAWRGYLAQHALADRVPELSVEAPPPAYVPPGRGVQRRVWLGPAGCHTPLHRDLYHNLFCQVAGRKRFRLYAPQQAAALYPFAPPAPDVLRNTSRVDVRLSDDQAPAPDAAAAARAAAAFPRFASEPYWEADLAPGEALAMPASTWHAVLALDASLSVSYWWT